MAKTMEQLIQAREEHGFTSLWTIDGRILFKRQNESKSNLFYDQKLKWCFCVMHERKSLCCLCKNLFFIFYFGGIMRRFLLSKKLLTGRAPLINELVFKKFYLQFFNHYFIISFIKFVAMIMLQILKLIKNFLVSIIILLSVNKRSNV